mmetsp:Transcript_343/g.832  ORF Transcript_343/g.832 Transcript_343/m.832 type:complete len:220 (-) Transcript_343:341-1000(-)
MNILSLALLVRLGCLVLLVCLVLLALLSSLRALWSFGWGVRGRFVIRILFLLSLLVFLLLILLALLVVLRSLGGSHGRSCCEWLHQDGTHRQRRGIHGESRLKRLGHIRKPSEVVCESLGGCLIGKSQGCGGELKRKGRAACLKDSRTSVGQAGTAARRFDEPGKENRERYEAFRHQGKECRTLGKGIEGRAVLWAYIDADTDGGTTTACGREGYSDRS